MILVTGEVGSGKSTALRFAVSRFHPSEYRLLWVTATGGSIPWRTSLPLSSRIIARSHLKSVDRQGMEDYLNHHLRIAGLDHSVFSEQAITAIHQGSGGLFRKANHLTRGALIAAASEKCPASSCPRT